MKNLKFIFGAIFALALIFVATTTSSAAELSDLLTLENTVGLTTAISVVGFGSRPSISKKEIEAAQNALSNYNGNQVVTDSYFGGENDNYFGNNDLSSFVGGQNESGSFAFRLQNKTAGTLKIAISASYLGTAAAIATNTGLAIDALLKDGTITGADAAICTAVSSSSRNTIDGLLAYCKLNPLALTQMVVKANSEQFFGRQIAIGTCYPVAGSDGTKSIELTRYVGTDQLTQTKAFIDFNMQAPDLQIDSQRVIVLEIGGTDVVATTGEIVDITLSFGRTLNSANILKKERYRKSRIGK